MSLAERPSTHSMQWWTITDSFIGLLIVAVVVVLAVLALRGHAAYIHAAAVHNRAQVAECKALGGFARTRTDETLLACSFPGTPR